MDAREKLLSCLPQPPDFAWNWAGLAETSLARLFDRLARTPQNPAWHGEGNVWIHTKLVCEALASMPEFRALGERQRRALALAALLHDAGKPARTRLEDGKLVSPGHAAAGAQLARRALWQDFGFCGAREDMELREAVCLLIRFHGLPPHLLEREDGERRVRWIAADGELAPEFTLAGLCMLAAADVRGRIAPDVGERLDAVGLCAELARECGCLNGPCAFASAHTQRAYLAGRNVWPQQELFDDCWGEVLLLCGLPGAGKDTWLRAHRPDLPVISLDAIRAELGLRPEARGRAIQVAHERARKYLRARQPFARNATSLTPELRGRNIALFENYGAAVRVIYLEAEWEENLRRNAGRPAAVPEAVIDGMLDRLFPPERGEARQVDWLCV